MPLAPERIEVCMALRIARRNCTRPASCSATPWATSCASISGFLTSRMFSCTCLPVSFSSSPRMRSATATDHDARTRGVDVHPHAVPGALDLDLGDAGPLHALGQELADRDVLTDVALVELVGVPAALVVRRDPEAEAVRVDLLAHQAFRPFFSATTAAGCTASVMWLVRLLMRVARPCARGRQRFIVGPSSTVQTETTRSPASRPSVVSALAIALSSTL